MKNVLIYTVAIGGVVVIVALIVFFWKRSGFGSGRAFGNRIAAHVGIPRNVFHMLLVNGGAESGDILKALEKAKLDVGRASIELGPLLSKGIGRIEARFGTQEMVDKVKPIVAELVSKFEMKR